MSRKRIDIFDHALPPLSSLSDGDDISNDAKQKDATIKTLNGIIQMKEVYMSVKRYSDFMGAGKNITLLGNLP